MSRLLKAPPAAERFRFGAMMRPVEPSGLIGCPEDPPLLIASFASLI
jgi:hypothetical protein